MSLTHNSHWAARGRSWCWVKLKLHWVKGRALIFLYMLIFFRLGKCLHTLISKNQTEKRIENFYEENHHLAPKRNLNQQFRHLKLLSIPNKNGKLEW